MSATYDEAGFLYDSPGSYDDPISTPPFALAGVGIELRIYDKLAPYNLIDVIPQRLEPTYLEELRGPGGGSFKISKTDPKLLTNPNLLDYRNVVRVYLDGELRGAWIITKKSEVLVGAGELSAQAYQVSGPGLRQWLSDAVVYPLEPLGKFTKTTRTFSFASKRGSWYNPAEWLPVHQMNRQDARRGLTATFLANAVALNGDALQTLIKAEEAKQAAADAAGTTYDMKTGSALTPATAPDGKARRTGGYVLTSTSTEEGVAAYQLYGTTTNPSIWWWDADGWHRVVTDYNNAPSTHPATGAVRYPKLLGPGYVAYAMIDPVTGVWDSSFDLDKQETARHIWWDGQFHTTTNPPISDNEIPPPGHSEVNPWIYGPKDWPTGFAPHARWIWSTESRNGTSGAPIAPAGDVYFRREFTLTGPGRYMLSVCADNAFVAYMDGESVIESQDQNSWFEEKHADLELSAGDHILAIKATNWEAGSAGVLCALLAYGNAETPTPSYPIFVSDNTTSHGGSWLCVPYPDQPPGWTPGEVLLTLLAEAGARGVSSVGRMKPTFTALQDSYGNPWDRTVDWSFDFGTEYSDIVTRIEEIKADFAFEPQEDGSVRLHAYVSRGTDKSIQDGNIQPVVFRPGHNVTTANEDNEFSQVKNSLLTSSQDGWFAPQEAASQINYGRVEGFLNVSGTAAMANEVANATLVKLGLVQDAATLGFEPFENHVPWVNFGVGDLVLAPASAAAIYSSAALKPRRIMSLSFSEDEMTSRVLYAAEFGTINRDRTERIERWLKSVSDGTLGGAVANATGNGSVTGSAPVTTGTGGIPTREPVVVNPILIGEVISGANIMPGSIMASDKLVANSITAGSAIIADAAINSAMIESLSANKISAGTIMAEIALAGRIATALTGQRAEMDSSGFHLFNSLGQETFRASTTTGEVFAAGTFSTGLAPDPRVVISDFVTDTNSDGSFQTIARIQFWSGQSTESSPAGITVWDGIAEQLPISLSLASAVARSPLDDGRLTNTTLSIYGQTPINTFTGITINNTPGNSSYATQNSPFIFYDRVSVAIDRSVPISTSDQYQPLRIGWSGSSHLNINQEAIQGCYMSGAATLKLNPLGGEIILGTTGTGTVRVKHSMYVEGPNTDFSNGIWVYGGVNAQSTLAVIGHTNLYSTVDISSTMQTYGAVVLKHATFRFENYPTGGSANVSMDLNGTMRRISSSKRYKENIQPLNLDVEKALQLTPRIYQRNDQTAVVSVDGTEELVWLPPTEDSPWEVGFVAEEAEDLGLAEWVECLDDGRPDGFRYMNWIVAQHAILQQHHKELQELRELVMTPSHKPK